MAWGILSYLPIPSFRVRADAHPGMTTKILPHQLLHRALKPLDRDREHALRKQSTNDGGGFRIVPMPLRHWIEPHRVRIGARDAIEPDRSGLLVDMLDRAPGHHDLVTRHRGGADEHHVVVA